MRAERAERSCFGVGFIVLDVIHVSQSHGSSQEWFAGGSCGNVLAILAFLGWQSSVAARLGRDWAGGQLLADLHRWDVATDLVTEEKGIDTPIVFQEIYRTKGGQTTHKFSRHCPICGSPKPRYRPLLKTQAAQLSLELPRTSVFYFDRVSPSSLELARLSNSRGSMVVFEPSGIKDEALFRECLASSHIVKYSRDRLSDIARLTDHSDILIEIQTLGSAGLRVRTREEHALGSWLQLPSVQSDVLRDAAGSGDWCTAGLIDAMVATGIGVGELSSHADVFTALRRGQSMAALNCAYEGARGLMYAMSRDDLESALTRTAMLDYARVPSVHQDRSGATETHSTGCAVCGLLCD